MPFKPAALIVIVTAILSAFNFMPTVNAQNDSLEPVESFTGDGLHDPCDPAAIGIPRINNPPLLEDKTLRLEAAWCFTVNGGKVPGTSVSSSNDGTLTVLQHIVLWEFDNAGVHVQAVRSFELKCKKSGKIRWLDEEGFVYFHEKGKVVCKTINLQEEIALMTSGEVDICNGELACEIPILNVVNYLNIPTVDCPTQTPLGKALFSYEEVELGFGAGSDSTLSFLLSLNGEQMMADDLESLATDQLSIASEQRGDFFDFAVNGQFLPAQQVSDPVAYFDSQHSLITFGFNQKTGEYYQGCFSNSIFDPYTGGPSFWGG